VPADVTVLGIRHHGPGSARAVADALESIAPDAVLIEGAPELDTVSALAGQEAMRPPVAGLVYCPDEPRRAAFYPFAAFSPEWWALRWGLAHGATTSFIDLAAAHQLADADDPDEAVAGTDGDPVRTDPLGVLAAAAGFADAERWWEDAIEHRHRGLDAFAAVTEAMAALREDGAVAERPSDLRREAAMRKAIRAAVKTHERVVVVCGAWHAPVLDPSTFPSIAHDNALLTGLPRRKVVATWVPWTHDRLAYRSGYGAGVESPGWYAHLMDAPGDVTARWLARTAQLLREEQVDTSSASVIEAGRWRASTRSPRRRWR
jgi:hypothetical protein